MITLRVIILATITPSFQGWSRVYKLNVFGSGNDGSMLSGSNLQSQVMMNPPDLQYQVEKVDPTEKAKDKDVALGEVRDIGAGLYVEAEQLTAEEVEQEGAKVLRILDWRLMPIVRMLCVHAVP